MRVTYFRYSIDKGAFPFYIYSTWLHHTVLLKSFSRAQHVYFYGAPQDIQDKTYRRLN